MRPSHHYSVHIILTALSQFPLSGFEPWPYRIPVKKGFFPTQVTNQIVCLPNQRSFPFLFFSSPDDISTHATSSATTAPQRRVSTSVPRQCAQSAHNKRVSPTTRPSSLHAQIQRQTTPFNSPTTSSRVQMTHFPGLCPVFDPVENHNSGHQTQSYRCLSLRPDMG